MWEFLWSGALALIVDRNSDPPQPVPLYSWKKLFNTSMGSHCFPPSWPLALPPLTPEKDLISFAAVTFNLHCALESPGKLDKLLVPRPDSGPVNLNSLGKRSGNSILKSPWWIAVGSQDREALTALFIRSPTPDGRGMLAPDAVAYLIGSGGVPFFASFVANL